MRTILINLFCYLVVANIFSQNVDITPIQEQLGQITTRLKVEKSGKPYSGTGFFFNFELNGVEKSYLVTNKHVIKDATKTRLEFNKKINGKIEYGNRAVVEFSPNQIQWINHPDSTIDLSILSLEPIIQHFKRKGIEIFIRALDNSLIPSDSIWNSFNYLDEVIMIGYPNGIIDNQNNLPIARTGTAASIPKLNFNNIEQFVYDISTFGGSSGSPVFIRQTPFEITSKLENSVGFGLNPKYYFAGIHYQGQYVDYNSGRSERLSIESDKEQIVGRIPINIGYAIKSFKLDGFISVLK